MTKIHFYVINFCFYENTEFLIFAGPENYPNWYETIEKIKENILDSLTYRQKCDNRWSSKLIQDEIVRHLSVYGFQLVTPKDEAVCSDCDSKLIDLET